MNILISNKPRDMNLKFSCFDLCISIRMEDCVLVPLVSLSVVFFLISFSCYFIYMSVRMYIKCYVCIV